MKYGILFIFFVVCFASCDGPDYLFQSTRLLKDDHWMISDSASFTFNVTDTNRYYNLQLEIDHGKKYPYENLYLRIGTTFPDRKYTSDLINIDLANTSGQWYSDCRGKTCSIYIDLQKNLLFPQLGKYSLDIKPWMRMDTVPEIYRIELKVEKGNKRKR